uniref:DNA endonuclease activator Ctp1 C-terminal domain-containing protein n=1 Tax=Panagrolaimus sp. ES5 TaxID=591445 RepID=A0AC34FIJ1_9BILA
MEDDIIFVEPSSAENTNDMSMDIFATDDTNNVKNPGDDSNISADIFDISDDEAEASPSKQDLTEDSGSIEIISPKKNGRKLSEKENIVDDELDDSIQIISSHDKTDDSDSIEIISPKKNNRKLSEKENIADDELDDSIQIISPVKKEPKPFFIPPNPNKPKTDLTQFIKMPEPSKEKKFRLTPIKKKTTKEEAKKPGVKNLTKLLGGGSTVKSKPGQTKMDSYLKWKDGKAPEVVEVIPPKAAAPTLAPNFISRNYRTPSPPRRHHLRSPSPTYSPLAPGLAAQFKAALESPGFVASRHSALNNVLEKAKEKAARNPKCKFSRALMNGYECRCCKDYYDAMGLEGEERREYVNKVSKHRGFEQAPPTPPRYWDIDVPSHEEQIQLGYVIETDSPLIKTKKKPKN